MNDNDVMTDDFVIVTSAEMWGVYDKITKMFEECEKAGVSRPAIGGAITMTVAALISARHDPARAFVAFLEDVTKALGVECVVNDRARS